jgi:uncharacterized RDD family membrane protein YckC
LAPGIAYAGTAARVVAYLIDGLVLGLAVLVVVAVLAAIFPSDPTSFSIAYTILTVAIELVYFVGLWASSYRATLGMRVLQLQIGNATDGRTLTPEQAVRRWIAMGFPLALLALIPALATASGALFLLWLVILTFSIAMSPTKQGLHDRFAGSAIARPAGASNAVVIGCLLLLLVVFVLLPLLVIVPLILLGGEIETMLSEIGSSI